MHLAKLPRFPLAQLPALTRVLGGTNLLIKRADQTGCMRSGE